MEDTAGLSTPDQGPVVRGRGRPARPRYGPRQPPSAWTRENGTNTGKWDSEIERITVPVSGQTERRKTKDETNGGKV